MTDLEAEYNNSTKIPSFAADIAGWQRDAAAFRGAYPHAELDLPYGPTPRQALDLFWPDGSRDAPLALLIHGGYWQRMDRTAFSHLAAGMLAHGVAVALPSYDLCPSVSLAALVEQVRAAAAFVYRRHSRPMLACGHSAGGHLAAMLIATDWRARGLPADIVPAALPLSGLFDLMPLCATSLNVALGLDEAEARRLSPMFMPSPGGRLHAVVGGDEGPEYARQSREMAAAWGGTWESVPGAHHMSVVAPLADPASPLVATAVAMVPR